jgi:hypothetical protein
MPWAITCGKPTHGLARAAQFTPDGNILFFTWNGVVSPAGQVLLATNRRSHVPRQSVVPDVSPARAIAPMSVPAVDPYSNRVP